MQDHHIACVSCPVVGAQTANERSRGLPLASEVMRWLTYSPSIVAASAEVLEESAADMQCTFAPRQLQGRPDRRT